MGDIAIDGPDDLRYVLHTADNACCRHAAAGTAVGAARRLIGKLTNTPARRWQHSGSHVAATAAALQYTLCPLTSDRLCQSNR
jgi:hypothetical protein